MFEFTEHGPVCEIRMAHPPVNAMSPDFFRGMTEAVLARSAEARAIVISGQPGMFSAGLDVITLSKLDRDGVRSFWGQFFEMLSTVGSCPVPIASAITGHSPAGGAVLAIHGDYRVMTRGDWNIGLNEVQVGLVVPPHIQRVLVRLVGTHRAERLLVAGALLSPEQALSVGLVDELADDYETTVAAAVNWCNKHIALPANAMLRTRELIRADMNSNYEDLSDAEMDAFCDVWFSEETQRVMGQVLERLGRKSG